MKFVFALFGVAVAGLACAQTPAPTPIPNGRLLASNCFQCHGTNGKGPGFEQLAGHSREEVAKALKVMQLGTEGSIMNAHAMGYTDAQIDALADYLSKQ
jgi:cytochrome c553